MSILDEFDPNSNPLFTPEHIYGKREKIADVCIVTFHHRVLEKSAGGIRSCGGCRCGHRKRKGEYITCLKTAEKRFCFI